MGYRIVDQIPRGSALSAYGRARGFRWNLPLLALVAGSLVLAALFALFLLTRTITLPVHRIIILGVRPSVARQALGDAGVGALPTPWRLATERRLPLPILLGVALTDEGAPAPFAASMWGSIGDVAFPTEQVSIHTLLPEFWGALWHDAAFILWGDALEAWVNPAPTGSIASSEVRGTWDGYTGSLSLPATEIAPVEDARHPLFAMWGTSEATQQPIAFGLLRQGIDLRGEVLFPIGSSLSVSPLGNRVLTLLWPDRTTVFTDTVTTTTDTPLRSESSNCPGTPHFSLEGALLRRTLGSFGVPEPIQDRVNAFYMTNHEGNVMLCGR